MENKQMAPHNAAQLDVHVVNHGSLFAFELLSPEAREWVEQNVSDDAQFFGGALMVEPRYAQDLAQGMLNDGLGVR
jgi:hypothetical protein